MRSAIAFTASHTPFDFSQYDSPYEIGRREILEGLIPAGQGRSAIDAGCGPGYYSKILTAKNWKTTAIDTDSDNIEIARKYAEHSYLGDVEGVLSTLPENLYDFVIALEIIEHMPKMYGQNLLKNIRRVLRSTGGLLISTPNRLSPEGLGGTTGARRSEDGRSGMHGTEPMSTFALLLKSFAN